VETFFTVSRGRGNGQYEVAVHGGGVGANENSSGHMRERAWERAGMQGCLGASRKRHENGWRTRARTRGCGQHAGANVHRVRGCEGADSMLAPTSTMCADVRARTGERRW
jgi:hypothetical protein